LFSLYSDEYEFIFDLFIFYNRFLKSRLGLSGSDVIGDFRSLAIGDFSGLAIGEFRSLAIGDFSSLASRGSLVGDRLGASLRINIRG